MNKLKVFSKIFGITGLMFFVFTATAFSETYYLRYNKKYIVPVSVCENLQVTSAGNPIERVIYLDDVGVVYGNHHQYVEDPNGVQDLIVIMALAKMNTGAYEIDLRGVGTTSKDPGSHKVIYDIVKRYMPSLKVRARVPNPAYKNAGDKEKLKKFIIDEALAMKNVCGNHKLIIAEGGPLDLLNEAMDAKPEIVDLVKVITIEGWNHFSTSKWIEDASNVKGKLFGIDDPDILEIILKDPGYGKADNWKVIPDKPEVIYDSGYSEEYFNFRIPYESKNTIPKADLYTSELYDVYNRIENKLPSAYRVDYREKAKDLNIGQRSGHHPLRTADFLSIYELILHDNSPWRKDSHYSQRKIIHDWVIPAVNNL